MENGTALVIGGAGGLGEAICRRLPEEWGSLVFTYFGSREKAEVIRADLEAGCKVGMAKADLRSEDDVRAALAQADAAPGGLKAVILAAGANILQPYVSQIAQQTWQDVIEIELLGFARLVRLALPLLRANHGGAIVSVVSVANYWFPPGDAISAVPKAGIEMLTRAVAKEEARYGVRANSVAPGVIDAGLGHSLQGKAHTPDAWEQTRKRIPLRRFGEAREVAEAVHFLASSRASYITGQTIVVDSGLKL